MSARKAAWCAHVVQLVTAEVVAPHTGVSVVRKCPIVQARPLRTRSSRLVSRCGRRTRSAGRYRTACGLHCLPRSRARLTTLWRRPPRWYRRPIVTTSTRPYVDVDDGACTDPCVRPRRRRAARVGAEVDKVLGYPLVVPASLSEAVGTSPGWSTSTQPRGTRTTSSTVPPRVRAQDLGAGIHGCQRVAHVLEYQKQPSPRYLAAGLGLHSARTSGGRPDAPPPPPPSMNNDQLYQGVDEAPGKRHDQR